MDNKFNNLKAEYSLTTTSQERKKEIFEEMRSILLVRNGNNKILKSDIFDKIYDISTISIISDFNEIDGQLNRQDISKLSAEIAKEKRKEYGLE